MQDCVCTVDVCTITLNWNMYKTKHIFFVDLVVNIKQKNKSKFFCNDKNVNLKLGVLVLNDMFIICIYFSEWHF